MKSHILRHRGLKNLRKIFGDALYLYRLQRGIRCGSQETTMVCNSKNEYEKWINIPRAMCSQAQLYYITKSKINIGSKWTKCIKDLQYSSLYKVATTRSI